MYFLVNRFRAWFVGWFGLVSGFNLGWTLSWFQFLKHGVGERNHHPKRGEHQSFQQHSILKLAAKQRQFRNTLHP